MPPSRTLRAGVLPATRFSVCASFCSHQTVALREQSPDVTLFTVPAPSPGVDLTGAQHTLVEWRPWGPLPGCCAVCEAPEPTSRDRLSPSSEPPPCCTLTPTPALLLYFCLGMAHI